MKKVLELLISVVFWVAACLNIYMATLGLEPLVSFWSIPISLVLNSVVYYHAVQKVRDLIKFNPLNALNWALAKGHNVVDYGYNWTIFTASLTMILFLLSNWFIYQFRY
jgi:hypothetical protein